MTDWSLYTNFSKSEFDCTHCGKNEMKPEFLSRLQALRMAYGKPMTITSGYRCPHHPIEAQKIAPGAHASGLACDVAVRGADLTTLFGSQVAAAIMLIGAVANLALRTITTQSLSDKAHG